MTLDETRELGIEFEKRIQALDPTFAAEKKLSTDVIYSYLNAALRLIFVTIYGENIKNDGDPSKSKYLGSVLGAFVANKELTSLSEETREYSYKLPDDYFSYIRSNSTVDTSYKSATGKRVLNIFLRNEDFSKYINEYFDEGVVLRRPVAVLASNSSSQYSNKLIVRCDKYTTISQVDLYYYRYPVDMNLFDKTACELPYMCFDDIVSTAVLMFDMYSSAKFTQNKQNTQSNQKDQNTLDKQ